MTNENLQSRTIDILRFPFAIAVVFIHGFGEPSIVETAQINWNELTYIDCYNLFRIAISHVIASTAVPFFFLIAGYFFFYKQRSFTLKLYLQKLRDRKRRIFLPYILWMGIYLAPIILIKILAYLVKGKPLSNITQFFESKGGWHIFWDSNVWGFDNLNWLNNPILMSAPDSIPLWFLRDLMVLAILSPFIYLFLSTTRKLGILCLTLCYLSGIWFYFPGLTLISCFYFSLGAYLSLQQQNLVLMAYRLYKPAVLISLILFFPIVALDGQLWAYRAMPFFIIASLIAIIGSTASFVKQKNVVPSAFLKNSSFFVYLLHTNMILWHVKATLEVWIPDGNLALMLLRYILITSVTVVCCLGIYAFLKRYFPNALAILTGEK